MVAFNPGTPVTAVCAFTLATAPGSFQGPATWTSSNPKDVITSVDDTAAGTSTATIDGSANSGSGPEPDRSVFTCTGDGDKGKGVFLVSATSEEIQWTDAVEIVADGAQIQMQQATKSTPAQAAAHTAALSAAPKKDASLAAHKNERHGRKSE